MTALTSFATDLLRPPHRSHPRHRGSLPSDMETLQVQFESSVSCICKRCSPIVCPLTNSAKQQLYVCLSSIAGLKSFVQLRPPFVFVLVILQRHSSTIFLVFLRWSSTKLQKHQKREKCTLSSHNCVFSIYVYCLDVNSIVWIIWRVSAMKKAKSNIW